MGLEEEPLYVGLLLKARYSMKYINEEERMGISVGDGVGDGLGDGQVRQGADVTQFHGAVLSRQPPPLLHHRGVVNLQSSWVDIQMSLLLQW